MSDALFFEKLPSFSEFSRIGESSLYVDVPSDWVILLTDVKGSTKEIEKGRYRDINTLGAASIVAAQNVMGALEFPFVFGGDGATLVIPPEYLDPVFKELCALKDLAINQFQMELRIGKMNLQPVLDEGYHVRVAKLRLEGGRYLALFSGGGVSYAEEQIKNDEKKQASTRDLKDNPNVNPDSSEVNLQGLSCRWNAIPSERGTILSVLIEARDEPADDVYAAVLSEFNELFDGQLSLSNPVRTPKKTYKSVWKCIKDERRFYQRFITKDFLARLIEIIFAVGIFRWRIRPVIFDSKRYEESMATHNDAIKFDDTLRMVMDCSEDQAESVKNFCESQFEKGKIFYGIHESSHSLMTCFVKGVHDGAHIHFLDGDGGGYAMAAKDLKSQKSRAKS